MLQKVREFVNTLAAHVLAHFAASLGTKHLPQLVEAGVERAVIKPKYPALLEMVCARFRAKEKRLAALRKMFHFKPQRTFQVAEELVSAREWEDARRVLGRISEMLTPYEQLDCLMEAAAAIYTEIRKAQTRKDGGSDGRAQHPKVVGADEFTPIWVYVVCKCDARNLYAHAEIMWACGDPKALSGQAGYYLTQLSSALTVLEGMYDGETKMRETEARVSQAAYAELIEAQVSSEGPAHRSARVDVLAFLSEAAPKYADAASYVLDALEAAGFEPSSWVAELQTMQREDELDGFLGLCLRRERQLGARSSAEPEPEPEVVTAAFEADGPIGIVWQEAAGGAATVKEIRPDSAAASAPGLATGMALVAVNGTPTAALAYAEQIQMIRDA